MAENFLLETLFRNRGYTPDYLRSIELDAHDVLLHADDLCSRLHPAYMNREHVVCMTDFDTDGITAGVSAFAGLSELGFYVSLFLPDPKEGYGFDASSARRLLSEFPDVSVVITSDVGITCHEGVRTLRDAGVTVLVTDHHLPEAALPPAQVIVDPMLPEDTYAHPRICGAYVMYQCLQLYADTYCDQVTREQIRRLRVFAGIGTVSDGMPLLYENRAIVRDAISICQLLYSNHSRFIVDNLVGCTAYRRAFIGLYEILVAFAEIGKIERSSDITAEFFGYYLAPMLNSVKRIGPSMAPAFGIFFGDNPQEHVAALMQLTAQRKEMEAKSLSVICEQTNPYAPYAYLSDAPAGILGLLAQRMRDKHPKGFPCMVLREKGNGFSGSGRSPSWYPCLDRLRSEGFYAAGHNDAFGVGVTDVRELKSMLAFLDKDVNETYAALPSDMFTYRPDFVIDHRGGGDTVIDIVLFMEYMRELSRYEPFGSGFQKPDILLRFRPEDGVWSRMGSLKQHLKVSLAHGFEVLLFYAGEHMDAYRAQSVCEVRGTLSLNEFMGNYKVNFTGSML